jgi:hypothetical protein
MYLPARLTFHASALPPSSLPPLPFPHLRRLAPCHLEGPLGSLRLSIRWRGPCLTAGGAPIPATITLSTSTTAGAMQAGPRAVNVSLTITLLHRRHSRVPSPTPPLPRAPPRLSLSSFPLHPTGLPLRRSRALPLAKNRATTANPTPVPVSAVEDVPQALVRPTACVGLGLPLSHLRVRPLVCRWRRGFLQAAGRGPYGGNVPRCVGARRSGKRAPSLPPQHSQHSAHRNAPRALVVS